MVEMMMLKQFARGRDHARFESVFLLSFLLLLLASSFLFLFS